MLPRAALQVREAVILAPVVQVQPGQQARVPRSPSPLHQPVPALLMARVVRRSLEVDREPQVEREADSELEQEPRVVAISSNCSNALLN
jgi:hypothetical protein